MPTPIRSSPNQFKNDKKERIEEQDEQDAVVLPVSSNRGTAALPNPLATGLNMAGVAIGKEAVDNLESQRKKKDAEEEDSEDEETREGGPWSLRGREDEPGG